MTAGSNGHRPHPSSEAAGGCSAARCMRARDCCAPSSPAAGVQLPLKLAFSCADSTHIHDVYTLSAICNTRGAFSFYLSGWLLHGKGALSGGAACWACKQMTRCRCSQVYSGCKSACNAHTHRWQQAGGPEFVRVAKQPPSRKVERMLAAQSLKCISKATQLQLRND